MEGPCSLCRRASARDLLRRDDTPPGWVVMEAGYDSRCPGCGGFINQGERIYRPCEGDPFICGTCALEEM